MTIIKFIKNNKDIINKEFEINNLEEFKLVYKKPNEVLNFIFKGSGTFGNVFQVTNNTNETSIIPKGHSLVVKIMKRKRLYELDKTKKIQEVINSSKNKYIIDKYVMNIYNVDMDNDLIFLEYIEGNTLDEYIKKTNLSDNELNIFFIKTLLSIKVFHNMLNYSHRDIKGRNIIYVPETGIMKCIDYGFICKLNNKNCSNKYEGTGNYIHPDMNKKYSAHKYNNTIKFPDSIAQDFFSTIILLLKIYAIHKKTQIGGSNQGGRNISNKTMGNLPKPMGNLPKPMGNLPKPMGNLPNNQTKFNTRINLRNKKLNLKNTRINLRKSNNLKLDNILIDIIYKYDTSFRIKKETNKKIKIKQRFESKFVLLQDLMKINENNIDNDIIKELIKIIKTYWDFQMNTFCINKKKNILISNFIFDTLVFNSLSKIPDSEEKNSLLFDWSIIYSSNLNV